MGHLTTAQAEGMIAGAHRLIWRAAKVYERDDQREAIAIALAKVALELGHIHDDLVCERPPWIRAKRNATNARSHTIC